MKQKIIIVWFRKCLRINDNFPLQKAYQSISTNTKILPLFTLDPTFTTSKSIGIRRWIFLLESLADVQSNLKSIGLDFIVFRSEPVELFKKLIQNFEVEGLFYEKDTEPYAIRRDESVEKLCSDFGVFCEGLDGHTLFDVEDVIKANGGSATLRFQTFEKIISKLPKVRLPFAKPDKRNDLSCLDLLENVLSKEEFKLVTTIPTVDELNLRKEYDEAMQITLSNNYTIHKGGETEALKRLSEYTKNKEKVLTFEKPKTSPAAFNPADTTVLSPYLKFGCLSVRVFYHKLKEVTDNKKCTQPPVSLLGQLYWREFYYVNSFATPNYGKMEGNPICLQIPWKYSNSNDDGKDLFEAWKSAKTGYPWIDAIMTQLKHEGWIHHLARHSVACFLTRGDLYISWERGVEVFDELLLDADYALNVGNWLWLSASSFFHQYFRIYSPNFGQKYDKTGVFIRRYLPVLKDMPDKYVYEPWNAPLSVQEKAGCVVGRDYPERIVVHEVARKECLERMKVAYDNKVYGKVKSEGKEKKQSDNKRKRE